MIDPDVRQFLINFLDVFKSINKNLSDIKEILKTNNSINNDKENGPTI